MDKHKQLVEIIAENVETRRKALDLSVDKLSKVADLSLSALNKLRLGKSTYLRIDTVYALAKALGCTVDDLLK